LAYLEARARTTATAKAIATATATATAKATATATAKATAKAKAKAKATAKATATAKYRGLSTALRFGRDDVRLGLGGEDVLMALGKGQGGFLSGWSPWRFGRNADSLRE